MPRTTIAEPGPEARNRTLTMRAACITAPGLAVPERVPMPEPKPREVRVRIEGCGVCGSNLPVWEGRPWFEYPRAPGAPGHEAWGRVAATGSEVTELAVGDRVAMLSDHAFAEYDVADAGSVVVLPPALAGVPFPGEAFGCAANVIDRCGDLAGLDVAVVGAGFLGVAVTALATHAGARVFAISRRSFAREAARSAGAVATFGLDDSSAAARAIMERTAGRGCPVVIEAAGVQATLDLAARLTAVRGRLVIAGYHQDGLRQVDLQLWNWRGLDVINAHEREPARYVDGMRRAIAAVERGALDPASLVTHRFPLEALGDALDQLAMRPEGFLKAVVLP